MNEEEIYLMAIQAEHRLQMVITYSILGTLFLSIIALAIYVFFFESNHRNRMRWREQRRNKRMSYRAKQRRDLRFALGLRRFK